MKKLIILIEILIIISLLMATGQKAETQGNYFIMSITAYSRHPSSIADKWNDGYTATMTKVREGVAAINVNYIDGKWVVVSPLKLGDKIHIEGLGEFTVEDTGRFAERDEQQDIWTCDIYIEDNIKAVEFGRQLRKVFVINN